MILSGVFYDFKDILSSFPISRPEKLRVSPLPVPGKTVDRSGGRNIQKDPFIRPRFVINLGEFYRIPKVYKIRSFQTNTHGISRGINGRVQHEVPYSLP